MRKRDEARLIKNILALPFLLIHLAWLLIRLVWAVLILPWKLTKAAQKSSPRVALALNQQPLLSIDLGDGRSIPTVEFDRALVTPKIKISISEDVRSVKEIPDVHFDEIYTAAVESISRGGDLALLKGALDALNLKSLDKRLTAEISQYINNRAKALISQERQLGLGLAHAEWIYSGAPCMLDPRHPSATEKRQDERHKAANGTRYDVRKGVKMGRKYVLPGQEWGCRCISRAVVPGFD